MANAILSVWRCIVRHGRHIPEPRISADLRKVKRILRNHRTYARQGHIRALFEVEHELRKVCLGEQSLAKARGCFQSAADKHANKKPAATALERNQETMKNLWKQHEERRFDEYNKPPRKESSEWWAVDRRARVSNNTAAFLRTQPDTIKRSTVIDTIFAPFWKAMRQARYSRAREGSRPRSVELSVLNRVGGTLSLLRVRGVKGRGRGLRRYVDAVSRGSLDSLKAVKFELWLARQYALDPLGDPDMDDWIETLNAWKQHIEMRHRQQEMKFEVQRRILIRRRAELNCAWEWRFRRHQQTLDRRARLESSESHMLRLNTL